MTNIYSVKQKPQQCFAGAFVLYKKIVALEYLKD
jgi:hypothetical protein